MNYIKITKNDIANGNGLRVVLWLSGCSHNCKGCHNPQTHNPNNGILFDGQAEKELFEELKKPYISGITISGGDPLHEANLTDVLNLVNKIRILLPQKTIWLYSGYTFEECLMNSLIYENISRVQRYEILKKCDVMVDGRYIESQRDITLHWRGSRNQRVIDIQQSLNKGEVVLYEV